MWKRYLDHAVENHDHDNDLSFNNLFEVNVDKFGISNQTALTLSEQALKSYLKIT